MIENPTPVTAGVFNGMWLTSLRLILPTTTNPKGVMLANFQPTDGTHILANKDVRYPVNDIPALRKSNTDFETLIANLLTEAKRQSGKTVEVKMLIVEAPEPSRPVTAFIEFIDKTNHRIPDCYALAGTDHVFAGVLTATLAGVAKLAGFGVA